jgi:hypothetical protein
VRLDKYKPQAEHSDFSQLLVPDSEASEAPIYISTERRVFYHHPYFKNPIFKSFFCPQKKGKKGNHA